MVRKPSLISRGVYGNQKWKYLYKVLVPVPGIKTTTSTVSRSTLPRSARPCPGGLDVPVATRARRACVVCAAPARGRSTRSSHGASGIASDVAAKEVLVSKTPKVAALCCSRLMFLTHPRAHMSRTTLRHHRHHHRRCHRHYRRNTTTKQKQKQQRQQRERLQQDERLVPLPAAGRNGSCAFVHRSP